MRKEQILKAYLSDNLFIEKKYIKEEKIADVKWSDQDATKLITIIKIAIDGEDSNEGSAITARKINQLLNRDA